MTGPATGPATSPASGPAAGPTSPVTGPVVADGIGDRGQARPRRGRRLLRPVLSALASVALVVGVFWYFLPQFTSISAVWSSIRAMTWRELTTLGLAAVWNLGTYLLVNVAATPGLTYRQAAVATEASTAVSNTVPGGGAIGIALNYAMFSSWGFSRSRTSVSVLVSGVWNNFAKLGMPVLALAILALQGGPSAGRLIAGLIGLVALIAAVAVFALLLRSRESAVRVGLAAGRVATALRRVLGRGPVHGWEDATAKFRDRTVLLLRARWHWITATTLVSHVSLFLVLLLALRHVGVSQQELSWVEVLAVFAFARLLTAIPITPGGLGVVELALITGLSAAGGDRAGVAAAVLVFRALTYVLPIPLGLASYVFWRRNRSWRRPAGTAPHSPLVPRSG
ncbi:MAG TPA: lysylphosphatidylglycerol synthase transmembrane domain-containing protein [Mycobacteriales bacterium]|nr:lysylphosphatidylglycerol synthase transmembrane domain-containing protein [Mycobacteriales bacterium]